MPIVDEDVNTAGAPEMESAEAPAVQDAVEGQEAAAEAPVEAEGDAPEAEPEAGGPPPTMPYGRFREVVADRNALKRELAEAKAQLAARQRMMPEPEAAPAAPMAGGTQDAEAYLAKLIEPTLKRYLAPLEVVQRTQEREAFKSRYRGKVDDEVLELAATKYELAVQQMRQENPRAQVVFTPDDVLNAELGSLFLKGLVSTQQRAASTRAQVAKVNAAAKTPAPRGRAPEAKFDPNDPNITADQLLAWAQQNGVEGL